MRSVAREMRPVTEGARKLREYLDKIGESVPVFCEKHGLRRYEVEGALRGDSTRFSVDFALSIWLATNRKVGVSLWASSTAKPMVRGALSRSNNRPRLAATD